MLQQVYVMVSFMRDLMQVNIHVFPSVVSLIVHIAFIIYLLRTPKELKKIFIPFFGGVLLWAVGEIGLGWIVVPPEEFHTFWYYPYGLLFAKIITIGVVGIFLSAIYVSFMYPIRKITKKEEKYLAFLLILAFLVYIPIAVFTPVMVWDLEFYAEGYGIQFGPLLIYWSILILAILGIIFYNFYSAYMHAKTKIEKTRVQLVAIGSLIFVGLSVPINIFGDYIPGTQSVSEFLSGSFYTIFLDVFLLYGGIKYKMFSITAVVENGIKDVARYETKINVEPGDVVIVLSKDGRKGFETFRYLATKMPGLCITTKAPKDVRAEFEFTKLPVIWVSEITSKENTIEPAKLEFEISYHIYSFLREGENRVVYIDDLDYLSAINGFQNTHEFLKSVADEAVSKNSVLIFSVTSEAYNEQEISFIKSIASKELAEDKEGRRYPAKEFNINTGHAIMVEALGETRAELKARIKGYKVLGVSAHFPKKFTMGFPEGTEIKSIWITETSAHESAISPRKMEFDVSLRIISFIKENPGKGLVYIDTLPIFMLVYDFINVLKFVKDIVDLAHEYDCKVVFEVPPNLFKPEQKVLFERRMDVIYTA